MKRLTGIFVLSKSEQRVIVIVVLAWWSARWRGMNAAPITSQFHATATATPNPSPTPAEAEDE
jgi:hypothetical protein